MGLKKLSIGEPIDDVEFDKVFPENLRGLSENHWTQVAIARRAAELSVHKSGARVLDVGSGVGKFCIVGALTTSGVFFGVEQRKYLVDVARAVVSRFEVPRVEFEHGNMADLDWRSFDTIYLYNPYSENLDDSIRIDDLVSLTSDFYIRYIFNTQQKLASLSTGTRVVTLNGFGGDLPPCYKLIHKEECNFLPLEMWEKVASEKT